MSSPLRLCPICGQTDDHPRHVITLPEGMDVARHMDCCAQHAGCPVCASQLADAGDVKGEALRAHLTGERTHGG
jgi:hypothetical protein